jgi:uncharacterized membrane protein YjjB (DUF3815 family)
MTEFKLIGSLVVGMLALIGSILLKSNDLIGLVPAIIGLVVGVVFLVLFFIQFNNLGSTLTEDNKWDYRLL